MERLCGRAEGGGGGWMQKWREGRRQGRGAFKFTFLMGLHEKHCFLKITLHCAVKASFFRSIQIWNTGDLKI